ncbi:hypothetical protein [Marinobacter subterrani]|uniref:hypothetical protein n=1 Tax=Marinobacter subterrani TaxID=1658765 RepID=UPI0018CED41A|nr:hypothetical protein [Marinobacter subterrani]
MARIGERHDCLARHPRYPSRTLPFVAISWLVVTVKFLIAGMTLGPLGEMPKWTPASMAALWR